MCAKVAIVTGGNKGIGHAVVKALCEQFDGDVYLTARDADRGLKAVDDLNDLGQRPEFHQLDVTDGASVARFARFVQEHYPGGVNVLVNNAGVDDALDAEHTVTVNYFGLRTVCDALFPLLAPGARVVNVSSSLSRLSLVPGRELRQQLCSPRLTVDELDALMRRFVDAAKAGEPERHGWSSNPYVMSKIAVTALTFIQQRAFDVDARRDLIANSVHPGRAVTEMTDRIRDQLTSLVTVDQAAAVPVYLALLPEGERTVKGQYVWSDKTVKDWYQY